RPLRRPILGEVLPIPAAARAPSLFGKAPLGLADLDRRPAPRETTLIRALGLTQREAALAARLAEGLDPAEAAARLQIGRETARTHLKSISHKTDTKRQTELVALLQRLAARLG